MDPVNSRRASLQIQVWASQRYMVRLCLITKTKTQNTLKTKETKKQYQPTNQRETVCLGPVWILGAGLGSDKERWRLKNKTFLTPKEPQ